MGQRLKLIEIDKRVQTKVDRSITTDTNRGIVKFGEDNDYPQKMERLILSSNDARAIANIYAKFLVGKGFENEAINKVVVGKDARGKKITLLSLLRQFADSASFNNGGYIHVNKNIDNQTGAAKLIPFKYCRFSEPDTQGFSGKIGVYENWEKDKDAKFDKSKVRFYDIFSENKEVFLEQIAKVGALEKHKGQIYFQFFDNNYLYPLSPFDPVYLDCDTQAQISIFKNNQIRNGFTDKVIFRVAGDEDAVDTLTEGITKMMGADGDNAVIIEDVIDPATNKINKEAQVVVESVKTNINDKLFETWEKSLTNNIRKSNKALPAVLIDYEESKLGTTSGEGITQAMNFYNAMTADDRSLISEMFKEIFSNSMFPELQANQNWNIKPLSIEAYATNNPTTAAAV